VLLGCALNRYILIDNLFGPDLFRGSLAFSGVMSPAVMQEVSTGGFSPVFPAQPLSHDPNGTQFSHVYVSPSDENITVSKCLSNKAGNLPHRLADPVSKKALIHNFPSRDACQVLISRVRYAATPFRGMTDCCMRLMASDPNTNKFQLNEPNAD
jgi:hypothetical protein